MQGRPDYPVVKDLVLIGGGHTHALVLRMWAMAPVPGVRVTLINPDATAPYTGMLPGLIAGHYQRCDMMIDLVRLARFAGARIILDRAVGIDRDGQQVLLAGRAPLPYDVASLDIGITSDLPDLPGYAAHGVAAKPLGAYADRWEAFVARGLTHPQMVVIGGGVGGIELALASAHRLAGVGAAATITVLERGETVLPALGAGARRRMRAQLAAAGVTVLTNAQPARVTTDGVVLTDARQLPADFTLAVAGARPHDWLQNTGLRLHQGYVAVAATLQSSDPAIFAAGDCAHQTDDPRPKAGVFAVRAAPVLLHNLRAALLGQPQHRFVPQRDYLKLISTGGKSAVAEKWGVSLQSPLLWRVKDRIDRAFMAKFEDFPTMPAPALPRGAVPGLAAAIGDKPLCGGCGAKLAANDLAAALAALPAPKRGDVLSGRGDDAAILQAGAGLQVITTDHLRAFCQDPRLMARIAAIHAMGDIWAMGAAPQVALAQITLPRMAAAKSAEMLAEIMAEAAATFGAAGADVVGGHTSVGAELTIGFTVTGLAARAITKAGARTGDAVILTKPLGSGTLLAAEMAMARVPGLILGDAVAMAWAVMCRPLAAASAVIAPHASAMTDVTGFGLAGHLLEMLDASGGGAVLRASAIPLLPGAAMLARAGQASSLAASNHAATLGRIDGNLDAALRALLHDPQTAGGLLATLPADKAEAVVAALLALGEPAAIIGEIVSGPARIRVI